MLISEDVREGGAVAPEDLVEVIDDGESASLVFPEGISPTWRPKKTAPISAAPEVKQSTFALLMRAESLRIESDRLTSLRDALLPELLSGRMRVRGEGWAA
ncbi:restriction endonuclease subunit S [Schaalia vaccimaxillae]|uniref:restriction endonuclease subunit S n=1 Tax=Schaalia vaccimaxillae TaxID=183916 RepID=UPI0003B30D03|nr:hypothetical protein [Schaalia vaccimaxillae]